MKAIRTLLILAVLIPSLTSCKKDDKNTVQSGTAPVSSPNIFSGVVNGMTKSSFIFETEYTGNGAYLLLMANSDNLGWILWIDKNVQTGQIVTMESSSAVEGNVLAYIDNTEKTYYLGGDVQVEQMDTITGILRAKFEGTLLSQDGSESLPVTNGKVFANF